MNVFGYGFRPFFLLAGLTAPLLLLAWLAFFFHNIVISALFDPMNWHAHEMLFGFVSAMIAGFLLTAVPNWTGEKAQRGTPLVILSVLWIAGRLALLLSNSWLASIVDLAFYPVLFVYLFPPIWRKGQAKTLVFVPVLFTLWIGNLLMHLQAHKVAMTAHAGIVVASGMIMLLITIISGRVIPFFTTIALGGEAIIRKPIEVLSMVTMGLLPVFNLWSAPTALVITWSVLATVVHSIRLAGWWRSGVWRVPMLWILYLAYSWIVVGLALSGIAALGWIPVTVALHAFTAGSISAMGLGIMARASLGHSGRPLIPSPLTIGAFALVNLGAFFRVFGPMADLPDELSLGLGGGLWCLAFFLFFLVYAPILISPRPDGKEG